MSTPEHLTKFEWYEQHQKWLVNSEAGSRANLRGADLRRADLRGAGLRGADLRGANLRGATGKFAVGSFGRHQGIAAGGYISIGCERHTFDHWLDNFEKIGKTHDYSEQEIVMYGQWIKMVTEWLKAAATE